MLVDIEKLNKSTEITSATENNNTNTFSICTPTKTLRRVLGQILPDQNKHFVTAGAWSLHDLVDYVVDQIGPIDLIGYTWSITQPAADMLIKMKLDGKIKSMSYLIDGSMSKWSKGAIQTLKPLSDKIRVIGNHAKGFIAKSDSMTVSVISSANFSNNPRIEAGVLSTSQDVYDFNKNWLEQLIINGVDFEEVEFDFDVYADGLRIPETETKEKSLFIIRGLPGSGKSTFAGTVSDIVADDDDFFTRNGIYNFDHREMRHAKGHTQSKLLKAIEDGVQKISVVNVFGDPESAEIYERIGKANGYKVFSVIVENTNQTKSIHGVDAETINRMRKGFKVRL